MTESKKGYSPDAEPSTPKIAPEFANMERFNAEINDVGYARYNSNELVAREKEFAEMIGAPDAALFNSGMAAIHSTIEAEGLMPGDTVLCAEAIYGTTKAEVKALKKRGIRVVFFDATLSDKFDELFEKEKPRLVIAETVANSKNMPVTDLGKLAESAGKVDQSYKKLLDDYLEDTSSFKDLSPELRSQILDKIDEYKVGNNPFVFWQALKKIKEETGMGVREIVPELSDLVVALMQDSRRKLSLIIDNTLPSPVLINPLNEMQGSKVDKVIVESATKHYQAGKNEITAGIAYSDNPEKIANLKARRIELGTYLQPTDEQKIPADIRETMPGTMKKHAHNALSLAKSLDSSAQGIEVFHPNLPKHKQHELVQRLAPEGAVTLFYIELPEGITGEQFMDKVKEIGGDKVGLGSSFGHQKTWLSNYSMDGQTVRIAAGSEDERNFDEVIEIFNQALSSLK